METQKTRENRESSSPLCAPVAGGTPACHMVTTDPTPLRFRNTLDVGGVWRCDDATGTTTPLH